MQFLYVALIVGAGPAGCAAAFDLARAGCRVLLLDKRSFPRGKACACGLTRKTLKALRYSVEPVLERECRDVVLQEAGPAFRSGRRAADKACEVRVRLRQPFCAMAVRERFDHFCLTQTLAAGRSGGRAELRRIDTVLALRELPTHIELDIRLPDGTTETLCAPALLGADGSNGQTRRLANGVATKREGQAFGRAANALEQERLQSLEPAEVSLGASTAPLPPEPAWYARGFALEATVPFHLLPATLPAGDHRHDLVFDFAPVAGGYGWLFPKGNHVNIGVGGFVPQRSVAGNEVPSGDAAMLCEAVTRALLNTYTLQKLGIDLTELPDPHVTGQHLGLGGHAYIPQGRILLTGDAAGLVDPLTGEGIHSAITSGQAAAAALLETLPLLSDPSPLSAFSPSVTPPTLSSRPEAQPELQDPCISPAAPQISSQAAQLAAAYARHLRPLQETLAFSQRAARSFYREPGRGFRVMRTPLLRNLVLKTYADGLPTTKLLTSLARRVA